MERAASLMRDPAEISPFRSPLRCFRGVPHERPLCGNAGKIFEGIAILLDYRISQEAPAHLLYLPPGLFPVVQVQHDFEVFTNAHCGDAAIAHGPEALTYGLALGIKDTWL
ncbi:large exoproteins [Moorella thermoacetica Y72]|uniref:Large exoproteins n=1 Tax=Moorella thermoacetica Y72 TaxID=1325331 RepID=A0A0S6U8G6_NEOTH|nr:large exoproteins [Moorella thermoacetica Y72]